MPTENVAKQPSYSVETGPGACPDITINNRSTFEDIRRKRDTEMAALEDRRRPLLAICRNILADMETPVSAYCKVKYGQAPGSVPTYSFLLESVEGGEHIARYSFIGIDPYLVMTQRGDTVTLRWMPGSYGASEKQDDTGKIEEISCHDPLKFVESELSQYRLVAPIDSSQDELPRFHGGAVGYLAYEAVAHFEHLPVPAKDELGLPLAVFCFTETVVVFDHLKHRIRIVTHLHLDAPDLEKEYARVRAILHRLERQLQQAPNLPDEPPPTADNAVLRISSNRTAEEFEAMVLRAQDYIREGDIFQVVLSQRLNRHVNAAPFTVYRALRAINPAPYMFFLDLQDFQIIGASPELLVRAEDGVMTIHPIAGTRPRGADPESDQKLAEELKNDPKERAEHVMLVDLARNDVGRVSVPGSVKVSQFMEIERYSHVMHLVSNVTGQLRPDVTPYDALRSGFPAGTVSGAPKIRAMEIICELEGEQRGVYAGAVGYFGYSGNLDTAIALRTMVMRNGKAYIQAGSGIVADSVPTGEYWESMNKAKALLRALDEAELIANARRSHSEIGGSDAATD
ncbi:MAG TPA: anthranilate synthase component I [Ktedonobacteraceae bacterium]|nr:anthranilate synthase component I [Ktedonobacteraceae bacterium]